ncbi:unnamed protein product [Cochlearia groenlandica]
MGDAFFKKPFAFTSPKSFSFSTPFVRALVVPALGSLGGHGIVFILSASIDLTSIDLTQANATQFLGLFNISTQGSPCSHQTIQYLFFGTLLIFVSFVVSASIIE